MILSVTTQISMLVQCDGEPRCVYENRSLSEFSGTSLAEAVQKARNAGWTVGGPMWFCPQCHPTPHQQTNLEISPKGVRRLPGGPPGRVMPPDKPTQKEETEQ